MEIWEEIRKEVREIKERVKVIEEKMNRAIENECCAVAEGSTPTAQQSGYNEEEKRKEEEEEQERQEKWEREKRRRNIIMKGKRVEESNWKEECKRILREAAGREVEVNKEWERGDGKGGKIWIAEIKKEEDKEKILSMRKEIERTERVSIDRDRTYEERETLWRTRQKVRELREEGREVEAQEGRVKCDGRWWRWDAKLKEWRKIKENRGGEETDKGKEGERKEREERERKEKKKRREEAEKEKREIEERMIGLAIRLQERERELENLRE